jgi:hypothetical protein
VSVPLQFQDATIRAAWRALTAPGSSRRYLVADEVGLGKTIVAQGLIKRLLEGRDQPLRVFYVCNNLAIAHQNREKLLEVLPEEERAGALCEVDRLSLLPGRQPDHPRLRVFSLTPQTSMPRRKGQPRKGRWLERALLRHLSEPVLPGVIASAWNDRSGDPDHLFRFDVGGWSGKLAECRDHADKIRETDWFERALRLELLKGTHAPGDLDAAVLRLLEAERRTGGDPRAELMGRMRNALAALALLEVQPDLVVFDEFQRFRDLLDPPPGEPDEEGDGDDAAEAAARVLALLRGDQGNHRPMLLLLSATPYRLVTARHEDAEDGGHHRDFFDVLEFLAGHGDPGAAARKAAVEGFRRYRKHLELLDVDSEGARTARDDVTRMLTGYIARTERSSFPGEQESHTAALKEPVEAPDLRVFKHFATCVKDGEGTRSAEVAFWSSIPMPMQSMGDGYTTWKRAKRSMPPDGVRVTARHKREFRPLRPWPHPGLRALTSAVPADGLLLPWVAPSAEWWPMAGPWRDARAEKWLLFSRFRAVPPTVASALSMEAEHLALGASSAGFKHDGVEAERLSSETQFNASKNALALFLPWPTLARLGDPRRDPGCTFSELLARTKDRVRRELREAWRVPERPTERGPREIWELLVGLEGERWLLDAVGQLAGSESGLGEVHKEWLEARRQPLTHVSPEEVDLLAEWALTAPGVVLGRALSRHVPTALERAPSGLGRPEEQRGFSATLDLSWRGLRTYLDRPWFLRRHRAAKQPYADVVRGLVRDGNLESALDEHLWILRRVRSSKPSVIYGAMSRALSVRASEAHFRLADGDGNTVQLRAHAALPFVDAREATRKGTDGYRPDELRDAFNSPFWPHVLCTTSVGQEGLDFHLWCRKLVHWDLPSNPVDLEQREGRVRRFGGLAVRRVMARDFVGCVSKASGTPWDAILASAEEAVDDSTGLQPWWSYPGADVERHYIDIPFSRREAERRRLQDLRWVYRVVLGQPHQEDLMEKLAAGLKDPARARAAAIELCPLVLERRLIAPPEAPG